MANLDNRMTNAILLIMRNQVQYMFGDLAKSTMRLRRSRENPQHVQNTSTVPGDYQGTRTIIMIHQLG